MYQASFTYDVLKCFCEEDRHANTYCPARTKFVWYCTVYNTTVNEIVRTNELPNPNNLVIGQALVILIKGRFYWVQLETAYFQ